jgi:hypothetical protein
LVVAAVAMGGWEKIPLRWIKRATGFLGDIGGEGRARYIRRMCRLGSHSVKQLVPPVAEVLRSNRRRFPVGVARAD